jgi:hypothetical protein
MTKKRRGPTRPRTEPAPGTKELTRVGWCRRDAEHLSVVEFALSVAGELDGEGLRVLAGHVATALRWEPVLCGVQVLLAQPEHAAAWRALAGAAEGGDRDVMHQLAALADGRDVVRANPADMLTAEDLRLYEEARQAESRGELAEALRILGTCMRPLDDPWVRDLEQLVARGDRLTPAAWGRWICSAALRWCQTTRRGMELGQHYGAVALRALGVSEELVAEQSIKRAAYDQIVHDALLWDEGGLAEFLERDLAPAIAARVPGIASWPDARLRVLCLIGPAGENAICEDVLTGERLVVGDHLLAAQHPPGRLFIGRVVGVLGDDRCFFAMKPTIIENLDTALAVADLIAAGGSPEERIDLQHRELSADAA